MPFALEDGQAIQMRADATREERVPRIEEVLRRDRGCDGGAGSGNECRAFLGGDVLEHDLEARKIAHDRRQRLFDEGAFAIEYVDVGGGGFAMQGQHDAVGLHRLEHGVDAPQRGDSGVRIGGGTCRVILDRVDEARCLCSGYFGWACIVREVERHQRQKAGARRQGAENPLAVQARGLGRRDRGPEIWHDDCSPEYGGRGGEDSRHRRPVTQVEVPIVRAGQGQRRRNGKGDGHEMALFFLDYTFAGGAGPAPGRGSMPSMVADPDDAL